MGLITHLTEVTDPRMIFYQMVLDLVVLCGCDGGIVLVHVAWRGISGRSCNEERSYHTPQRSNRPKNDILSNGS